MSNNAMTGTEFYYLARDKHIEFREAYLFTDR